jgi:hypothetical protein
VGLGSSEITTVSGWLTARLVELGAALCTSGVLVGGLAIGVPFLQARIPETFLYSFCCIAAVLARALLDLAVRAALHMARALRPPVPARATLRPSGA